MYSSEDVGETICQVSCFFWSFSHKSDNPTSRTSLPSCKSYPIPPSSGGLKRAERMGTGRGGESPAFGLGCARRINTPIDRQVHEEASADQRPCFMFMESVSFLS